MTVYKPAPVLADFPGGPVFGVWRVDPRLPEISPTFYTEFLDRDDAVSCAKRCGSVEPDHNFYVVDTVTVHQGAQRIT